MPKLFGFYQLPTRAKAALIGLLVMVILASSVLYVQAYHRLKPIYEVKTDKKIVALTFDISWGNKTPGPVLDILKENNLKCTFSSPAPGSSNTPKLPNAFNRTAMKSAATAIVTSI